MVVVVALVLLIECVAIAAQSSQMRVLGSRGISLVALGQQVCPIAEAVCCSKGKGLRRLETQLRQEGIIGKMIDCFRAILDRVLTANLSFPKKCCMFPILTFFCNPSMTTEMAE